MDKQLYTSPGEGWQRVKLTQRVGPTLPVGQEGWAISDSQISKESSQTDTPYRFVTLTNHEVEFRVYSTEIEIG